MCTIVSRRVNMCTIVHMLPLSDSMCTSWHANSGTCQFPAAQPGFNPVLTRVPPGLDPFPITVPTPIPFLIVFIVSGG